MLKKISAKSNAVEREFNVYRYDVGGKKLTDNDISRILVESHDSKERQAAWEARKTIGRAVLADLMAVVALRNEAARKLGFKNFHAMQLYLNEQSDQQVLKLFDELDELTREPYRKAKAEIDAALAKSYGITVDEVRPWHYHDPYFAEVPAVLGDLPESVYKPIDTLKVCREFYEGIGMPIDDVLKRSSLYEQPGKCPHAFETDIDRTGNNVRILVNIVPGREWLATTLHELGHATYSKYLPRDAAVFAAGRSPRADDRGGGDDVRAIRPERRLAASDGGESARSRAFSGGGGQAAAKPPADLRPILPGDVPLRARVVRESQPGLEPAVVGFDREVSGGEAAGGPRRARLRRQVSFCRRPCYYHNYMLGELFASQVHHALIRAIMPDTNPAGAIYVGNKKAGEFMRDRVYSPGLTLDWNQLTRHATGEELNAKAFAEDIK